MGKSDKKKKTMLSKDETEKKLEALDHKLKKQKLAFEQFLKQIEKEKQQLITSCTGTSRCCCGLSCIIYRFKSRFFQFTIQMICKNQYIHDYYSS